MDVEKSGLADPFDRSIRPESGAAAKGEDSTTEPEYKAVLNHEEQYSIWPANRANPAGWFDAGYSGSKEACLNFIKEVWTDMRPLSLRRQDH